MESLSSDVAKNDFYYKLVLCLSVGTVSRHLILGDLGAKSGNDEIIYRDTIVIARLSLYSNEKIVVCGNRICYMVEASTPLFMANIRQWMHRGHIHRLLTNKNACKRLA